MAKWTTLDVSMFPKELQAAVSEIQTLEAACYAKVKPLKDKVDALMKPFVGRIVVDGEKVLQDGHKMSFSYRDSWSGASKFACASFEPKAKKSKTKVELA